MNFNSNMSVAVLRNLVNPVCHYYDNDNAKAFLLDESITIEKKAMVLYGESAVNPLTTGVLTGIIQTLKTMN